MRKNASAISIAYFTFLLLVVFSGTLVGAASEAMYFLAYIVPFFAVVIFTDREVPKASEFSLSRDSKRLFAPIIAPTVFFVALLSLLTSFVISLFSDGAASVDLGDDLLFALFYHALLPSVLEEMLFRFLPMRYLASESPRFAVIFSATFFSLAHHSFFSMPYAFFAGAVFMIINLLFESCLPSIILHFINNAISVVWTFFFADRFESFVLLLVLSVPTLISVFFVIKHRHRYAEKASVIFSGGRELFLTPSMIFAAVVALLAAVLELAV